ncbi:MAG: adenine-specific methyltransferase EcoRI family protein, partial [Paludibacter sp.]|nr:adenine-specific methyltransferase EcoRI family protein [Prevotella sp.]MCM1354007.1 adenine-specific methyltransferase EcoRI family protein [Bacteroides sp.]MCM1402407.1 adenine-specific methyltransferase EcoRI family protein [Bacteroides sp.]MCM1481956.1 adenine-specific methyltransferase EcoRI family protein [Paludibacter sp.]MCM1576194.1 adenine-specific methyltransferase EcoRI family protein [Bacteroides sp.]
MAGNKTLHEAKTAKNDEFYTQLPDIEKELAYYRSHFQDKVVLCNCDDPYESNFFKYFALNFNALGLRKLIATCYNGSPVSGNELLLDFGDTTTDPKKIAYKVEISAMPDCNGDGATDLSDVRYLLQNDRNVLTMLRGNGDFRSPECIELLQQADIVVTNPPFSLFREYVAQLVQYNKKYIILGNMNALTYREIFPLIKDNKMWLGNTSPKRFHVTKLVNKSCIVEDGKIYATFGNIYWYTNLDISKRHEDLILYKHYTPEEYPKY